VVTKAIHEFILGIDFLTDEKCQWDFGDTDLHFTIDGHMFVANVCVSPAVDDFLLGSDQLCVAKIC